MPCPVSFTGGCPNQKQLTWKEKGSQPRDTHFCISPLPLKKKKGTVHLFLDSYRNIFHPTAEKIMVLNHSSMGQTGPAASLRMDGQDIIALHKGHPPLFLPHPSILLQHLQPVQDFTANSLTATTEKGHRGYCLYHHYTTRHRPIL